MVNTAVLVADVLLNYGLDTHVLNEENLRSFWFFENTQYCIVITVIHNDGHNNFFLRANNILKCGPFRNVESYTQSAVLNKM